MTQVAKKYGLSDRGMAKLCERNGIPVPPRGYWAKKQAGQKLKQEVLPPKKSQYPELIRIYGGETVPEEVKEAMQTAREKQIKQIVSIQDNAEIGAEENLHKAVRATAKTLRKAKPFSDGSVHANGVTHCGITIGQGCIERVIRILDVLAKALDEQGLSLQPAGNNMKVANTTDEIEFSLTERARQRGPDLSFLLNPERAWPEFDYIRTGELGIQIVDQYVGGARKSWNDGKTQKLETMLGEIAVGIVAYLTALRLRREERERWHLEYEENQRKRALTKRREEREEKRRIFVNGLANTMTEIENLKEFLAKIPSDQADNDEFSRMTQWIGERIQLLEQHLDRSNLNASLQQNNLFPEAEDLT